MLHSGLAKTAQPPNYHNFDYLIGIGTQERYQFKSIQDLKANYKVTPTKAWHFIEIEYNSYNADNKEFSIKLTEPEILIKIIENEVLLSSTTYSPQQLEDYVADISNILIHTTAVPRSATISIQSEIDFNEYSEKFNNIIEYITKGDVYELNLCVNHHLTIDNIYDSLFKYYQKAIQTKLAPPFSAYIKDENRQVLCLSMERFLAKTGNKLISQPIKGTRPRHQNEDLDAKLAIELENSIKDRAENIMIVDLVRNDLSKISKNGTVTVDELCSVYSYSSVHQMISTISAELLPNYNFPDVISALFPAGSMTGAPKSSAMQIIKELEPSFRNLYSGNIGYIAPNGDFDLNVVIRTLFWNNVESQPTAFAGGAITIDSEVIEEWTEIQNKMNVWSKLFTS